jgi:hypothetical protein
LERVGSVMGDNDGTAAEDSQRTGGLNSVLPRTQLVERFGSTLILEEYGKADLEMIAKENAPDLLQVGGSVWNRIIQRKWHTVNPLQFASHFKTLNPSLYKAISTLLGVEVIRDIYYVKGWTAKKKKSNLVVELMIAWVHRNDLLLADVTFIDPASPIPKKERRFAHQTHQGLGLLPTLLTNMQRKAEELGCEQLTLTAATRDQAHLFGSFGFLVEDSQMGRRGMQIGFGIPMERDVRVGVAEVSATDNSMIK